MENTEGTTAPCEALPVVMLTIANERKNKDDAMAILRTAEAAVEVSWYGRILAHAAMHIKGEDISFLGRFAEYIFDETFEHYTLPAHLQYKPKAAPEQPEVEPGETVAEATDDAEPGMVNCVSGEHEYEEGTEPDCKCFTAECGCNIDPESAGTCDLCDQCDDCCSNDGDYYYCEGCDGKFSGDDMCGKCNYLCESCCNNCWYCEGCEANHSEGEASCGNCNSCDDTCKCNYCVGCADCPCVCPLPQYTAKTQKAKGLQALDSYSQYNVPPFHIVRADAVDKNRLLEKFVRPCPMLPRHGFVDSRYVDTPEEAQLIVEQTLAADAEAELILMPKVDAEFSGIWTPGRMVLGPGNDGATSGRKSVTVQVMGQFIREQALLKASGITDAPYVELLWKQGIDKPFVVQLRNGPALPQQIDSITQETKVKKVIRAEGDLLEWETLMKNQPAGTVVYHPEGSLASHYSVHAVLNNIPVLISRKPKVGEVLAPSVESSTANMRKVRAGFFYALTTEADYGPACYFMLLGVHSTSLWLGKQDFLLGAALGFAYRLSVTAAIGEWRYKQPRHKAKQMRDIVYEKVWDKSHDLRGTYMRALRDFRTHHWESGIGGESWFQFTRWAAVILNSVLANDVASALSAMNNAVHSSHNNGWGFNKFAADHAMQEVANNPVMAFNNCARLVYLAMTAQRTPEVRAVEKQWYKSAKPLPIYKADQWVRRDVTQLNLNNALYVQAAVVNEAAIRVQYIERGNCGVYSEHTVRVSEQVIQALTKAKLTCTGDGRVVPSLNIEDTEQFIPLRKLWNYNTLEYYCGLKLDQLTTVTIPLQEAL